MGIRVASQRFGSESEITLRGTKEEIEAIQVALRGAAWFRQVDGQVEKHEAYKPLFDPIEDPLTLEKWQLPRRGPATETMWNVKSYVSPQEGIHSPSFFVSHLCGYFWSKDGYTRNVTRLQSYGFECLRSRRDSNGRYWEVWMLPGIWAAEGDLKKMVDSVKDFRSLPWDQQSRTVVLWLCKQVTFGTLDVAVQRAAAHLD